MDNLRTEDFTIVISPETTEDGKSWTGALYTTIMHNNTSSLNVEDQKALYGICKLMCNSILLSNIDEDFRMHLEDFTVSNDTIKDLEEQFIDNNKTLPPNKKYLHTTEDNVIRIDFKTKTKGNA